jgi:predicted nucleic acid-binding protein
VIVLDASAAVDVLLRTPEAAMPDRVLAGTSESLHAPELLDFEVLATLRRRERRGELVEARAREAIDDLRDLPIFLHPTRPLLDRAWELRANVTAADGLYLALCEALGASLLTTDTGLARAARTHTGIDLAG